MRRRFIKSFHVEGTFQFGIAIKKIVIAIIFNDLPSRFELALANSKSRTANFHVFLLLLMMFLHSFFIRTLA